jgi:amidohydrolase
VCDGVDRDADRLVALADEIHEHPETAWQEYRAVEACVAAAAGTGLTLVCPAFGIPTAFVGSAGVTGPLVTICCEYDALPGMGHACGHNIIAAAGVGAARALAPLAVPLGGRIRVVGCPAEEMGGGKVVIARRGGFAGSVAVMLIHPGTFDGVEPRLHAAQYLDVTYRGRAAHAAIAPDRGINALDAIVVGYQGLAALRGRLSPTDKVHGILTCGGESANVVPALAKGTFILRSSSRHGLWRLAEGVTACFHAGAIATSADVELGWRWPAYMPFLTNSPLAAAVARNLRAIGRRPTPGAAIPSHVAGSTDLANVSQLHPSAHPFLAVAPPDVPLHTPGFARWATGDAAASAVIDGAKALALTCVDLWREAALRTEVHAFFQARGDERASPALALGAVSPVAITRARGGASLAFSR